MKKIIGIAFLATILVLTGCNRGGKKGSKSSENIVTESEFQDLASEYLEKENPYTTASMEAHHYQRQAGHVMSLQGVATYSRTDGEWVATSENIDSQYKQISNPTAFISFTMDKYNNFVNALTTMVGTVDTLKFTIGDVSKVIIEKNTPFTFQGLNYTEVKADIEWDEYGQLLKYAEKDTIDYNGSTVTIEDEVAFTYNK